MLLTLLKALNTTDIKMVAEHLGMSRLDADLLIMDAEQDGLVKIDRKKNKIKPLVEVTEDYYNAELLDKIQRIVRHYDRQEANITKAMLVNIAASVNNRFGYPLHDIACTLYAIEQGVVEGLRTYSLTVHEIKGKRPYHKFDFYTFLDHNDFGKKAVDKFIAEFEKKK